MLRPAENGLRRELRRPVQSRRRTDHRHRRRLPRRRRQRVHGESQGPPRSRRRHPVLRRPPEKVRIGRDRPTGSGNDIRGTVLDVSFIGVATQHLLTCSCPAEPCELSTNRISTSSRSTSGPEMSVWLSWDPGHAFGVPRRRRVAGARHPIGHPMTSCAVSALAHVGAAGGAPAAAARRGRTKRQSLPYLLLLPGMLWLLIFFVVPPDPALHREPAVAVPRLSRLLLSRCQRPELLGRTHRLRPSLRRSLLFAGLATFFAFCLGLSARLRHGLPRRASGAG